MSDLPNWVYDVVIELQRWSDEHPKLYTSTGGVKGYFQVDRCGCEALEHVPAEVRDAAKVISEYHRRLTVGPVTVTIPMTPDPNNPPPGGQRVSWVPQIRNGVEFACACAQVDVGTHGQPNQTVRGRPDPNCPVHPPLGTP